MMATPYENEKISAHDAAQISEHHTKPSAAATMDPERRKQVEKSLKRKLDARCSLFVLIYIMNCKTTIRLKMLLQPQATKPAFLRVDSHLGSQISIETTLLQRVWAALRPTWDSPPHNTRLA